VRETSQYRSFSIASRFVASDAPPECRPNYYQIQAVDTTKPAGKALFQMMRVFAEFERAMIQEQVKAGLKRARARRKRLGRPKVS
jgi:DNA invertase Pin-like site-specific DNA recombinase